MYLFSEDWILNSSFGPCPDPQIGAKLQEMKDVGPRDDSPDLTVFHHRHLMNAFVRELGRHLVAVIVGEATVIDPMSFLAALPQHIAKETNTKPLPFCTTPSLGSYAKVISPFSPHLTTTCT